MRTVVQRVLHARVSVEGQTVAEIGGGLLIFIGVGKGDGQADADRLASKIARLRIFSDDRGKMNRSVIDNAGEILVVSQFTLYADCSRGNRPGFDRAELPDTARVLVDGFLESLMKLGIPTRSGLFGADMSVSLVNDGPVTVWLDSGDLR